MKNRRRRSHGSGALGRRSLAPVEAADDDNLRVGPVQSDDALLHEMPVDVYRWGPVWQVDEHGLTATTRARVAARQLRHGTR